MPSNLKKVNSLVSYWFLQKTDRQKNIYSLWQKRYALDPIGQGIVSVGVKRRIFSIVPPTLWNIMPLPPCWDLPLPSWLSKRAKNIVLPTNLASTIWEVASRLIQHLTSNLSMHWLFICFNINLIALAFNA